MSAKKRAPCSRNSAVAPRTSDRVKDTLSSPTVQAFAPIIEDIALLLAVRAKRKGGAV